MKKIFVLLFCTTYVCAMESPSNNYELQNKATKLLNSGITIAHTLETNEGTRQRYIQLFSEGLDLIESYQNTNSSFEEFLENSEALTQEEITARLQCVQEQHANACATMIHFVQEYINSHKSNQKRIP